MTSKKDKVWEKAKTIRGENPAQYRQDPYRKRIRYASYGTQGQMGWEIDHIKPKSRGGSDNIRNLQALHWKANREKADRMNKKSRHSKANK